MLYILSNRSLWLEECSNYTQALLSFAEAFLIGSVISNFSSICAYDLLNRTL